MLECSRCFGSRAHVRQKEGELGERWQRKLRTHLVQGKVRCGMERGNATGRGLLQALGCARLTYTWYMHCHLKRLDLMFLIMLGEKYSTPTSASSRNSRRSKSTSSSRANSITGLVFQDQDCLLSCGAGDGLIKVWDLRKNYSAYRREPLPCYTLPYLGNTARNGFTNLVLDPGKVKLYANCMDSVIYCYNVATYEQKPVATYTGHQNATFYVKSCLSPDGLYLASGSSDDRAYIWNTNGSKRPVACLVGHGAEVTSVQWCPVGDTKIVTCSDDARHRVWQVGHEFEDDNDAVQLRGWVEVSNIIDMKHLHYMRM
ncbi:hypothetical protein ANN_19232 [Periplaneta americana]|uniref:Uncharacterized protein n=1 Tax=Periplaneta americana TaxID=6978 RepID=A0ABQ8SAA4_PERAM|nr:hypothetical protein ANN_19232 [Periplaneta americana]